MALPKEPRQKMINLMYLVLTALLALNVSAEILNAFRTIDSSLSKTNTNINASTSTIMSSFQDKLKEPESAAKAQIWYPKAQQVQQLSKGLYDYVDALRTRILTEAGWDPSQPNGGSKFKADNQDIATRIMIEQGEGKKLQERLEQYKRDVTAIDMAGVDPAIAKDIRAQITNLLQVDATMPSVQNKSNKTWQDAYFHMVPTVAAMTILSKFQNDVRTSENRVVSLFHEQVGKVMVRYDAFAAIVGQSSNYIMPGQNIQVTAGVGAFSKAAQPQITINGQGAPIGPDGQAMINVAGGGLGKHSVPVVIRFQDQDGKWQTVNKSVEYTVGQANASIALDKMNVLYIGVDNPVTIAASGGGDDKVQVSISGGGGSLTKVGSGKYIARVGSITDDCKISVSVDGKIAGVSQFRVRTVPVPAAYVGGMPSGTNTSAGSLAAQAGIQAGIKDFPFELTYRVSEYTVVGLDENGDVIKATGNGNEFTPQARKIISKAQPGDIISITNLYCTGPDGRRMKLPALLYNIQ